MSIENPQPFEDDKFACDELELLVTKWFFDNIDDGPYSEALYELLEILDENELILWGRVQEAETDQEKLDAENEKLTEEVATLTADALLMEEKIAEHETTIELYAKEIKEITEGLEELGL